MFTNIYHEQRGGRAKLEGAANMRAGYHFLKRESKKLNKINIKENSIPDIPPRSQPISCSLQLVRSGHFQIVLQIYSHIDNRLKRCYHILKISNPKRTGVILGQLWTGGSMQRFQNLENDPFTASLSDLLVNPWLNKSKRVFSPGGA